MVTADGALFVDRLSDFGDSIALRFDTGVALSYRELADRVNEAQGRLGGERCLILLETELSLASVVTYLAALKSRQPVILTSVDHPAANAEIAAIFDVDLRISAEGELSRIGSTGRCNGLHRDLGVLLSTSGSTGSAKLVRLSLGNVQSNARSIATYLNLVPDDVGALTLPLHYSYGLSVLNSHLTAGAGLCVSRLPITDPGILDWFETARCTNLSGVPYSYEIFERIGLRTRRLPHLRFMTAAGGRLPANLVRSYADHFQQRGGRFFVMYGQTEATARIAYLPPESALGHADCIGIAIPEGELLLIDESGNRIDQPYSTGELVYRGPNVMMGYATSAADLAKGSELAELRTGDLAERTEAGYFRIVGRTSRFSKLSGFRVSHDDIERRLAIAGISAAVTGDDRCLAVALTDGTPVDEAARLIMSVSNLQPAQLRIASIPELPRLDSGKVDYRAISRLASAEPGDSAPDSVLEAFRKAFWPQPVTAADTFLSLGGDSLAYVELGLTLETILGRLPEGWEKLSIAAIAGERQGARRWQLVDSNVYLRAAAILMVAVTHFTRWRLRGGAFLLMVMVGYSLGRFQSQALFQGNVRALGRQLSRNLLLYYGVLAFWLIWDGAFRWPELLLVSNLFSDRHPPLAYNAYWFVEAYAFIVAGVMLPFSIPWLRDRIAKHPLSFGLIALASGVGLLYAGRLTWNSSWHACSAGICMPVTEVLYWAAIGWCLYWAGSRRGKVAMLVLACICIATIHNIRAGEKSALGLTLFASLLFLLTWPIDLKLPRPLSRMTTRVAAASYAIYLFHLIPMALAVRFGLRPKRYGMPLELGMLAIGVGVPLAIEAARRARGPAGRGV